MEYRFEQETKEIWRERFYRRDSFVTELEGVVPDVNEDVGRIASVQCTVTLKSKELESSTLRIGCEIEAVVLYITENADTVSSVRMAKELEQSFPLDDDVDEVQAVLRVGRCEARILNPRKLAVSVQLLCESRAYCRDTLTLSLMPAGDAAPLLLGRAETAQTQAVTAVTEKTFAITESFVFPEERPAPSQILSHSLRFRLQEQNRIGTRLIVKGSMELSLLYRAENVVYPLRQTFTAPISQIVDVGGEGASCCTLQCVPTAVYLNLTDSISGGKALDAEVHALLQAVCRSTEEIHYLSDAYSNVVPVKGSWQELTLESAGEMEKSRITASELIPVGEDCADVLAVLPALSEESDGWNLELDILYRSKNGDLAAAKRQMVLKGEAVPQEARILTATITQTDIVPEGEGLSCKAEAELVWQRLHSGAVQALNAVEADEEHPYDLSTLPSVTLVRVEGESLWELARRYHSSTDAIAALNDTEEIAGRMLLIPRT